MDRRITTITDEILEHAFLYDDPDSFREGVRQAARAMEELEQDLILHSGRIDLEGPKTCPECMIPVDDADPDDGYCPWCGARNPEPLQELVWAEFRAVEAAWPEAVEG